ncbi:Rqc2 family fibronectin-binding protein [Thermus filiformis]|uniref:Rqc2 homolog RqcH n=1 Tax=Thermus filiformis TaxID=276 RepID=A0A0A2XCE2_THEFI|nr:NFACT family protein [Thermus filiformis]KGQ22844.1 RNA-biniding protein [Thermus filiformis]
MEGLLLHALLRELPSLPAQNLGLAFPDEGTLAVLLKGKEGRITNLVLHYRPPKPGLYLEEGRLLGEAKTPFQRMLEARLKGPLVRAEQLKLDRVVFLDFAGEKGFVDTPPHRLVFEATGRNANLLLLDEKGTILGVDRVITRAVNRYRELRPGLPYTPPPPYEKLDPRTLTPEDLRPLLGQPLKEVQKAVDGIGPELLRELAARMGLTPETPLEEAHLPLLYREVRRLLEDPHTRTEVAEELRRRWAEEEKEALRKPLLEALERERRTLLARLSDYRRALERLEEAEELRRKADVLMAHLHRVPRGAKEVVLEDFGGNPLRLELEAGLSPAENAQKLYERAKRLEALAERALDLIPRTEEALSELEREMERVRQAPLEELLRRERKKEEKPLGLRYTSPSGLSVWVGRNAKENDLLTRMAHSEDLWFHAQGVPGSHVILRTEGKNPPLEDLLFAARLAAYYSKARGERQVPVDYTRKKHVWRPRKAAPGQVLYTQAKTLFVEGTLPEGLGEG